MKRRSNLRQFRIEACVSFFQHASSPCNCFVNVSCSYNTAILLQASSKSFAPSELEDATVVDKGPEVKKARIVLELEDAKVVDQGREAKKARVQKGAVETEDEIEENEDDGEEGEEEEDCEDDEDIEDDEEGEPAIKNNKGAAGGKKAADGKKAAAADGKKNERAADGKKAAAEGGKKNVDGKKTEAGHSKKAAAADGKKKEKAVDGKKNGDDGSGVGGSSGSRGEDVDIDDPVELVRTLYCEMSEQQRQAAMKALKTVK